MNTTNDQSYSKYFIFCETRQCGQYASIIFVQLITETDTGSRFKSFAPLDKPLLEQRKFQINHPF